MDKDNEIVTSVFGKMTRRELLQRLALSGIAIGLTGTQLRTALAATPSDGVTPPPRDIGGTPFRELKQYQTYFDDKFDISTSTFVTQITNTANLFSVDEFCNLFE